MAGAGRDRYGGEPAVFALQPFDRDEAAAFLESRHPAVDAGHILDHLDQHKLSKLYCNPLTLGLMGRVAETDRQLPASRGTLFTRVCTLIWPEHDRDQQDIGLAQLPEDQTLDAAGTIAAALLFSGAETVSVAGAAQLQDGDSTCSSPRSPACREAVPPPVRSCCRTCSSASAPPGRSRFNFAVVVTLAMPGEAAVYSQVLHRVAVKPQVPVIV